MKIRRDPNTASHATRWVTFVSSILSNQSSTSKKYKFYKVQFREHVHSEKTQKRLTMGKVAGEITVNFVRKNKFVLWGRGGASFQSNPSNNHRRKVILTILLVWRAREPLSTSEQEKPQRCSPQFLQWNSFCDWLGESSHLIGNADEDGEQINVHEPIVALRDLEKGK